MSTLIRNINGPKMHTRQALQQQRGLVGDEPDFTVSSVLRVNFRRPQNVFAQFSPRMNAADDYSAIWDPGVLAAISPGWVRKRLVR